MRVLYFDQYFKTPAMAGGTRSFEMARRLVDRGHDVHLVTAWTAGGERRTAFATNEAGVTVHWIPVPYDNRMSFARRIRSFIEFSIRASFVRLAGRFDIVFATSTPLTIAIPGVIAARRQRAPFVFEVRDLWPELPIAIGALRSPPSRAAARALERWAYRNAEALVALSPGMKAGIVAAGVDPARVAIVPNASDLALFGVGREPGAAFRASRSWLGDRPLLVYAGTLGRINGVGTLVDIAVELRTIDPEVRILIVGNGGERDAIQASAATRGVLDVNLYLEPAMAKEEMPSLLSAADMAACLFVDLPEMRSNSANKFFDALAASTPLLINYGGWHHDLVRGQGIGTSIWRMNARSAAQEIAHRLRDPDWCAQAGAAGQAMARTWFDRDHLAAKLEGVLSAVVSGDRSRLTAITSAPAVPDRIASPNAGTAPS